MGIGSSIVKSFRGAISKHGGITPSKSSRINSKFVNQGQSGNGKGGKNGIRALSLHPEAGALLNNYYGIDLAALPSMTPEEIGDLVDFLRQAEWMDSHLEKLKEHFKKYIERQVDFNKFIAEITKAGLKGAESIDKAGLDTYLAVKGYTANAKQLGHKADIENKKLEAETENYIHLENYGFEASIKSMALKLANQRKEIEARPDKTADQQEINSVLKAEKDRVALLINYGTKGAEAVSSPQRGGGGGTGASVSSGNRGNIWTGLADFFSGK